MRDLALATVDPSPKPRSAAGGPRPGGHAGHPAGALLHDDRRRPPRLRVERQGATAGQGQHLADPPRPRLGQPGLAALVARRCRARHTLVRYDERGCGLSDWDVDVARTRSTRGCTTSRRSSTRSVSSASHARASPRAARSPSRTPPATPSGSATSSCTVPAPARPGPRVRRARRELAALGELIKTSWGSDQPGFRQVYDATLPARRTAGAVAGVRRAAAPIDLAAERPPAVEGVRVARLRRGGPPTRRADAHPPLRPTTRSGRSRRPRSCTRWSPAAASSPCRAATTSSRPTSRRSPRSSTRSSASSAS